MQPIRRILVAVKDPQGKPSAAVIKAAQLAQALGASIPSRLRSWPQLSIVVSPCKTLLTSTPSPEWA